MTARAPPSTALEIAMVMPRSLKDPVGFMPSYFRYRSIPGAIFFASRAARISGVLPSPSVITGVCAVTGRNFRYSSMIPRQRFITIYSTILSAQPERHIHSSRPSTLISVVGSEM
jgi:hypothetical protein